MTTASKAIEWKSKVILITGEAPGKSFTANCLAKNYEASKQRHMLIEIETHNQLTATIKKISGFTGFVILVTNINIIITFPVWQNITIKSGRQLTNLERLQLKYPDASETMGDDATRMDILFQ